MVGSYYWVYYGAWIVALVAAVAVRRVFRARMSQHVRAAILVVVAVCLVRLVLFDNPFTLRAYQWALTPENLGLRQGGVLELEIRKYRRALHVPKLANMAVGSSQVGAIFYQWASPPPEPVGVYSLAGMKPLDFVLNEEGIAAYNPQRVILYLSAFDMTGSPELFSLPLAPSRPLKMMRIYSLLRAGGLTNEEIGPSAHAYLFSQFLPEARYAFVYRAFLRQWFGGAPRPTPASQRLPEFSSYFDPQWLDYNFLFLREFFAFCHDAGIEVMIMEGQINPSARTDKIIELNGIVRTRIADLMREYPNISYVPASAIYEFSTEEYRDTTHVLPEAAKRYTTRFSSYLAMIAVKR